MKVADIVRLKEQKGYVVVTVAPGDTVRTLSQRLREARVGAAVVSTNGRSIDGVITERDIAHGLAAESGDIAAVQVSALMTRAVITCTPADDVGIVASTMLARNIRHLPVQSEGRLVGMISIRDVLNERVTELQQQTAMLRTASSRADHPPQDR